MKKSIYTLAFTGLVLFSTTNGNDFKYNKVELKQEFRQLDELCKSVESKSVLQNGTPHVFNTSEVANQNIFKPTFDLDDMAWGSFAWGFCCWPVGFFVVAINDSKSQSEKTSFWIGLITNIVLGGLGGGYYKTI